MTPLEIVLSCLLLGSVGFNILLVSELRAWMRQTEKLMEEFRRYG